MFSNAKVKMRSLLCFSIAVLLLVVSTGAKKKKRSLKTQNYVPFVDQYCDDFDAKVLFGEFDVSEEECKENCNEENLAVAAGYSYKKKHCACLSRCDISKMQPKKDWTLFYNSNDECLSLPCRNGGTCTDVGEGYECRCLKDFKGVNCEIIDYDPESPCLEDPCKNGATCVDLTEDSVGPKKKKTDRYRVEVIDERAVYKCECVPGYDGVYCENELNECKSQPCQNGGKCKDHVNGFSCKCKGKYRGDYCEKKVIKSTKTNDMTQCDKLCKETSGCTEYSYDMHGSMCDIIAASKLKAPNKKDEL